MINFNNVGQYPITRLRRNRRYDWQRRLVSEHKLSVDNLIYPLFVRDDDINENIDSMPGVQRYTLEQLSQIIERVTNLKIPAVALFPVIGREYRTDDARESLNPEGLLYKAIQTIKKINPNLGVITDGALDAYTSHGHDGLYNNGDVHNDRSVDHIRRFALLQAQAGSDIVAPSDMMDGRIGAIRATLDSHDYSHVSILAYSAKYASAYYGPFREALQSASHLGKSHKKTYHMDPANATEGLREVAQDIAEGADMVMIKPGLPYLDIVQRVSQNFAIPLCVYQVSGEYACLKAASQAGWLNYNAVLMETLLAFKRAGAHAIITYAALEAAQILKDNYNNGS